MLSDLMLSQFRSHRRLTMTADGRPVAIWGPNGAGKTNILEAISLLSPGRGLRRAAADELARRSEGAGWKVRATLAGDPGHEIETFALPGTPREVVIDGKPAPQLALGHVLRLLWLVPSMDRLWIESAEGRRRFLDRITLSFFPGHAGAALAYDKAMRERNRLLKDMVRDPAWYAALEAQMAEAGATLMVNRAAALDRIHAAQEGAATAFPAADLVLLGDGSDMATLADALARGRGADMAAGRTLSGPHRADLGATYAAKGVPAAQCSTGEQKALLLSLVLANARALAGERVVILLDEVAAHLDAGRRAALHDEVCALPAHVWMTGTGPELFDDLGGRAQCFEVGESDGNSVVTERTAP